MDETIDKLQIEIESDSSEASDGLTKLINTLSTIKAAVTPASESFRQLRDMIDGLNRSAVYLHLEPMRDALVKLADASRGINEIDFSGILEIGNVFTTLSNMFENADMGIGARLLQFTAQLKWGMVELEDVGDSIDEGAMQKLVNIGSTISELNAVSNIGSVDTDGLTGLARSLSNAIPQFMDAGSMIDEVTIERLRTFAYVLPEISQLLGSTSAGNGSGIANTVSSLYSLSDALVNLNSVALPSAQNLMDLRSALASFSGLRTTFDATGLRLGIQGIANAARAITSDEADRLRNLGSALSNLNHNFANMTGLSLNDANNFRESVLRIMDACRQIDENDLARLKALQGALSELRQSGGIQGMLEQPTQSSGGGSRGGIGGISATFQSAYSGIQATIRGIGGALDWLRNRISLSNTALGSFLSGLARIAKYRLLRTIIKAFTSGASEGLQNLAHASEEANATLTRLSTTSLLLKNSMGGALYSALATAMDWITAVGNAAARAIDFLSQFFAILGGRTTYMKAVSATQEFVDTTDKATSSVQGLKQELMGFDEINALSPDRSRGGGGSGAIAPDYGAMFAEAPVSKWLQDMMRAGDFTSFGKAIADKINDALAGINWSKIQAGAKKVVNSVTTAINGFFGEMNPSIWGSTIANAINTAAQFVSKFWNNTDWALIGRKVKSSILIALRDIDADTLAKAIVGRLKAAFTFLSGLLPSNADEWREVTGKIASIIQKIITNIPAELIGNTIGNVITGGLSMIKSLAEGMTLTNIATALKETLESAFDSITPEQIEETLQSVKKDIIEALKTIMSIKINIGDFEFSAVGAVIMASAVFNAIRGALSGVFSNTGFTKGKGGLMLTGALAFGLDAMMKISDIKEALDNGSGLDIISSISAVASSALTSAGLVLSSIGKSKAGGIAIGIGAAFEIAGSISSLINDANSENGVTKEQVAGVIGSSLQKAGLTLLVAGHPVAGLITFGIGIALEPVVQKITEMTSASAESVTEIVFGEDWQTDFDAALSKAKEVEELIPIFNNLTGLSVNAQQFFQILQYGADGLYNFGGTIASVDGARGALDSLFGLYATIYGNTNNWQVFVDGIVNGTSQITTNTDDATSATQGFIDTANGTSSAVDSLNQSLNETGGAVEYAKNEFGELNNIDFSGANEQIGGVGSAFDDTVPHITAAGDEAENVNEKIVEIPSETSVFIEITDYSTLISNLDTINTKFTEITDSVEALRLKISVGLAGALTSLKSRINGDMKSTMTTMGNQFTDVKKKVDKLDSAIRGLKGTSISIKVNAGLSSGARRFLQSLQNLDSYAYNKVHPVLQYSQFASGGFPDMGEMFIAKEAGPELVGKIGNRTAVANEEQIGDAIFQYMDEYGRQNGGDGTNYDAMAAALVSAMRSAGLGAVYLDGRMLAQSINRESARAGRPAINY